MSPWPSDERGARVVSEEMTVQRVDGRVLYATRGYKVFVSRDGGETWVEDGTAEVRLWRQVVDFLPLLRRLSRGGISSVLLQPGGARLCVVPNRILRAEAGSSSYRCVFRFSKGSRPLNLCQLPDGTLYWGEYFLNLRRAYPIHVYRSRDGGKHWDVAYVFQKGSICHIHRIVYDPYDGGVLVCTGDRDREVAILETTDGFRTLAPLVQGEQRYRTTSLIPLRDCILYGTDNPGGDNHIMELDRRSNVVRDVQKLPGPVLYGCRVGEYAAFATMVEKAHHEVGVWVGNRRAFRLVASFRSRKMNWLWRELVGYSTAILPEGSGAWPNLFCTPVGTKEHPNRLLKVDLNARIPDSGRASTGLGTGRGLSDETPLSAQGPTGLG